MNPETFEMLEWGRIIERLSTHCSTESGSKKAQGIQVNSDPEIIKSLLEQNREMRLLLTSDKPPVIEFLPLLGDELDLSVSGSTLGPLTIASLLRALRTTERLRRYFRERRGKYPGLLKVSREIADLSGLAGELEDIIDDRGEVKDSASPLLASLRKSAESARSRVVKTARDIMSSPRYNNLIQDSFVTVRNGRHVLPFKASAKGLVRGILHESSKSGSTIFMEPEELVNANNELRSVESDIETEIGRILQHISGKIGKKRDLIVHSIDSSARIDLIYARALLAEEMEAAEPSITETPVLELIGAKHPLLLLAGKKVVPNDIFVGKETKCLVVSGPNAGGKSVLIKTAGLLTLMAMAGLSIPASFDSRVGIFDSIFIAMGDQQSVEKDLSTFSADIIRLKSFLERGDEGCMVLLDEVITGTDPREGAALGRAYLMALVKQRVTVLVTTHYDEIKYLPFQDKRFAAATMGFSEEDLSPTFQLAMGVPGKSMGIPIAKRTGFPEEIIEEARKVMGSKDERLSELIDELTTQRDLQARLTDTLTIEQARLEKREKELEQKYRHIDEIKKEIISRGKAKALKIIAQVEEKVEEILRELVTLRKPESVIKAKDVLREMKKEVGESKLSPEVSKTISATRPLKRGEELTPGQKVFSISMGKEGTVESQKRGKVTLTFGTMRSVTELSDIRLYPEISGREERGKTRTSYVRSQGEKEMVELNSLDVRGSSVEDAICEVDSYLDRAALNALLSVSIIHGHGTGALKKALREHLRRSPYVEEFGPAPRERGGDGTTIVKLK